MQGKDKKGKTYLKVKSFFDIVFSILFLFFLGWLILILIVCSSIDTKSFGIFKQNRVGLNNRKFYIYKIKTINDSAPKKTSVFGSFLRSSKLDEFPQLINILKGDMSFVGPRPDVPGYADMLLGEDAIILSVKPGITGPASIIFRNEEKILAAKKNAKAFNDDVIWPQKVKINKDYVKNLSFKQDLIYLLKTLI